MGGYKILDLFLVFLRSALFHNDSLDSFYRGAISRDMTRLITSPTNDRLFSAWFPFNSISINLHGYMVQARVSSSGGIVEALVIVVGRGLRHVEPVSVYCR